MAGDRKPPEVPIDCLNYLTSHLPELFEGKLGPGIPAAAKKRIADLDFDNWKDVSDTLNISVHAIARLKRLCRATAWPGCSSEGKGKTSKGKGKGRGKGRGKAGGSRNGGGCGVNNART